MIRKTLYLVLFAFGFLSCSEENEFNLSLVPGSYQGYLNYYEIGSGGQQTIREELSKFNGFTVEISELGNSTFSLSFDKSLWYELPDVTVMVNSRDKRNVETLVYIKPVDGQAYSEGGLSGEPSSTFLHNKTDRFVASNLYLKSNVPDSTYYLEIAVLRRY